MVEYVTVWKDHEPTKLRWGIPVVRCEDCKHGRSPQQGLPWMCIRNCCAHIPIEPDGFCAWGERRDA